MLSVEQVRSLDGKVRQALDLIDKLKAENNMLRGKLDEYKQRVDQLEGVVDGFKLEQLEIEEGIKDVLKQLDQLEDQITAPDPSTSGTLENQAGIPPESRNNLHAQAPRPAEAELTGTRETAPEQNLADQTDDFQAEPEPPELEIF